MMYELGWQYSESKSQQNFIIVPPTLSRLLLYLAYGESVRLKAEEKDYFKAASDIENKKKNDNKKQK